MKTFSKTTAHRNARRPVSPLLTGLLIAAAFLQPTGAFAASVSRGCDYTLYINEGIAKTGSGIGSARTVYNARRDAAKNILSCFQRAADAPDKSVYCSNVSGGGFGKPLRQINPYIVTLFKANIQVRGDNGCFGKDSRKY